MAAPALTPEQELELGTPHGWFFLQKQGIDSEEALRGGSILGAICLSRVKQVATGSEVPADCHQVQAQVAWPVA